MFNQKLICGIDEAGRGPLAGPLVVAGAVLLEDVDDINDSKKISEKKREKIFENIKKASKYHIVMIFAREIDALGMSATLAKALLEIQENLKGYHHIFDGNSSFGVMGIETLVKADEKIKEVSAASILAKVTRDRYMCDIASKYPKYNFEKHKGYGTKAHIQAIREYGRCAEHRMSFQVNGLDR
ncbi:MAG: ribonuclease HII [Campylobacterales bacterium]|nr:ribonuclease HII [Campylobacterales bacterium]